MNKIYFVTGSQDLYGEAVLTRALSDGKEMAAFIADKIGVEVEAAPVVRDSGEAYAIARKANADDECIGIILWMHTFSPAKMWIKALQAFKKPLLHLHTQYNREIPYDTIDMDFMNLNQSAHGDREFGFICSRLGIVREVVPGYYKNESVIRQVKAFADLCRALKLSRSLKVAMFGNNMRNVAVTDGDRVESEIRYGWNVNYYAVGDLVEIVNAVTDSEVDKKLEEYKSKYTMATDNIKAVKVQAKYGIALEKFLAKEGAGAFTDTFEDLHGLEQLPGLCVQDIMSKGVGFGPEGDYKTSALSAVLFEMARGREGATGFLEDYTYDLTEGQEIELASHMLEVPPIFAASKPEIQVHPLSIGGKSDPARLVFDGVQGDGIQVAMVDMGNRFRLICADIELVMQPMPMPKLPVARIMWKYKPDFRTGTAAWIYAGGAHHSVVSTALTAEDIRLFAKFTGTEVVFINKDTKLDEFEAKLAQLDKDAAGK